MNDLINCVPPPETVQQRLAESLRETDFLRALLKISVKAERERQRHIQESQHGQAGGPSSAA